ncbi:MAG: hypothetical protein ACFE75_11110 [Candidatus Hodarchaeota archaeon]
MKRAQILGLIILIIGLVIIILSLWGAGLINWNLNSLSMLNMLFWLIIGIILTIIGLVSLVVSTVSKK